MQSSFSSKYFKFHSSATFSFSQDLSKPFASALQFSSKLFESECLAIGDNIGHVTIARTDADDLVRIDHRRIATSTFETSTSSPGSRKAISCLKWLTEFPHLVLAGCDSGSLFSVDALTGQILWKKKGAHNGSLRAMSLCPSSASTVVTAGGEGCVKIWDHRNMKPCSEFSPFNFADTCPILYPCSHRFGDSCDIHSLNIQRYGSRCQPHNHRKKSKSSFILPPSRALSGIVFIDYQSIVAASNASNSRLYLYDIRNTKAPFHTMRTDLSGTHPNSTDGGTLWVDVDDHIKRLVIVRSDFSIISVPCHCLLCDTDVQKNMTLRHSEPVAINANTLCDSYYNYSLPCMSGDGQWIGLNFGTRLKLYNMWKSTIRGAPTGEFYWKLDGFNDTENPVNNVDSSMRITAATWHRLRNSVLAFSSDDGRIGILRQGSNYKIVPSANFVTLGNESCKNTNEINPIRGNGDEYNLLFGRNRGMINETTIENETINNEVTISCEATINNDKCLQNSFDTIDDFSTPRPVKRVNMTFESNRLKQMCNETPKNDNADTAKTSPIVIPKTVSDVCGSSVVSPTYVASSTQDGPSDNLDLKFSDNLDLKFSTSQNLDSHENEKKTLTPLAVSETHPSSMAVTQSNKEESDSAQSMTILDFCNFMSKKRTAINKGSDSDLTINQNRKKRKECEKQQNSRLVTLKDLKFFTIKDE